MELESDTAFLKNLKTHPSGGTCSVMQALELLQGKWTAKIIFYMLRDERMRFGELKRAVPAITNTMLTSTLRELEKAGVVDREQFNEIPPHVEYSLTEKGKALLPVFYELGRWWNLYSDAD